MYSIDIVVNEVERIMRRRFQFQGVNAESLGAKFFMLGALFVTFCLSAWLLFAPASPAHGSGLLLRSVILLSCLGIYILRLGLTFLYFLKRKIPWWESLFGGLAFPIFMLAFIWNAAFNAQPLALLFWLSLLLYVLGSLMGTVGEAARYHWKRQPENQGHLYTQGLFGWSRHINYFADLLLFSSFAGLSGNGQLLFIPLGMFLSFVFWVIPSHDAYLAQRYGNDYEAYAKRVKRLIPYIY
jgi:protein-S-isoprenylcysteine O-methyltransferase Ste14